MFIDTANLPPRDLHRLMSSIVVPRPIAWITTLSQAGIVNLAPFSCFTIVSNKPPMLGVNIGRKATGQRKDTSTNILASREFVVNIGDATQMVAIHESSAEHAPDISEAELLGLGTLASHTVKIPRLADAPVSMECKFHSVTGFGEIGAEFFVGEVTTIHLRDGLYQDNKIDTSNLNPICRIGGPNYATLGEIVTLRSFSRQGNAT